MMKKRLTMAVLGLSLLSFHAAWAHGGAAAKDDGVVAAASDPGFEPIATPTGTAIHVEDHGMPMAPTRLKGMLTAWNGAEKSGAELLAAGDRLEARGVELAKGAKVVAALVTPAAKAITVRFTVK